MGIRSIRIATDADREDILKIKKEHVEELYRRYFLPDSMDHTGELQSYLNDSDMTTAILEDNGVPIGFIIFGRDLAETDTGMIVGASCVRSCDVNGRKELVDYVIRDMAGRGMDKVSVWLLCDNFRTRFLYEQLGFRRVSGGRTVVKHNHEALMLQYVYRIKK